MIDYSFLDNDPTQAKQTANTGEMAKVTLRVDADCFLLCDGEFTELQLQAGKLTKIQLPVGQHVLEFIDLENPNAKMEKIVDWPVAGRSYLVLVDDLAKAIAAAKQPQQAATKPEPAPATNSDIQQAKAQKIAARIAKEQEKQRQRIDYTITLCDVESSIKAKVTLQALMKWSADEYEQQIANMPVDLMTLQDVREVVTWVDKLENGGACVSVLAITGEGELADADALMNACRQQLQAEAKAKTEAEAKAAKAKAEAEAKAAKAKAEAEAKAKQEKEAASKAKLLAEAKAKKAKADLWKETQQSIELLTEGSNQALILTNVPDVSIADRIKQHLRAAGYQVGSNLWILSGNCCTPKEFYFLLCDYKRKRDIIIVDDADELLSSTAPIEFFMFLNAALNATSDHLVSYNREEFLVDNEGIPYPKSFYYNGGLIFIMYGNASELHPPLRRRSKVIDATFL
jgi:hypothetical protein